MFVTKTIFLSLPALLGLAFLTLLERKLLSLMGLRLGPNKVSLGGFLQPIGDAFKLSNKSSNILINYSFNFYYLSSFMMLSSSLLLWNFLLADPRPFSLKFSLILLMLILSFNSLSSILAGWSVFCKYSLIGSLRTVAQLISYEASLYMCLFFVIYLFNSFNLLSLFFFPPMFLFFFLPAMFYMWFPSFLAELNRTPYDFSEGESELVSGFNTEFGSNGFTLVFMAEYSNILFFCLLSSVIFFFFSVSFFIGFCIYVIWIRSVLPRFRFDKLMMLAWKFFIPFLTILFVFFMGGVS